MKILYNTSEFDANFFWKDRIVKKAKFDTNTISVTDSDYTETFIKKNKVIDKTDYL